MILAGHIRVKIKRDSLTWTRMGDALRVYIDDWVRARLIGTGVDPR
jgi:hypothetical protein